VDKWGEVLQTYQKSVYSDYGLQSVEFSFGCSFRVTYNVCCFEQPRLAPRGLCRRKLVNFILNQFTAARA